MLATYGYSVNRRKALLPVIKEAQSEHICSMVAELIRSRNRVKNDELFNPAEKGKCVQDIADGAMMEEPQLEVIGEKVLPPISTAAAQMQATAVCSIVE